MIGHPDFNFLERPLALCNRVNEVNNYQTLIPLIDGLTSLLYVKSIVSYNTHDASRYYSAITNFLLPVTYWPLVSWKRVILLLLMIRLILSVWPFL